MSFYVFVPEHRMLFVALLTHALPTPGARERWEKSLVIEQIKFDHGYTRSSRAVGFLLDVISEFSDEQLAAFLKVRHAPGLFALLWSFIANPHGVPMTKALAPSELMRSEKRAG